MVEEKVQEEEEKVKQEKDKEEIIQEEENVEKEEKVKAFLTGAAAGSRVNRRVKNKAGLDLRETYRANN